MEKILIVEDSRIAQMQLSDILAEEYRLDFQGDGPAGIAAAESDPPDLILLDIHLPGMDGYAVCQLLKENERTREIPVIFITSMDSEQEKVRGFEAGAEDYIVKPFYPRELLARVRLHLASRRARSQAIEMERLKLFKEMAVALSHEISNPLTAVFAHLYVLERELNDPGESVKNTLLNTRRELERIREMLQRLAHASKIARTTYLSDTMMIDLHGI